MLVKENFAYLRQQMVEEQLRARGISDGRVLAAMGEVPRKKFVPVELWDHAYDDCPLPIGLGQTISQPYVVALACQLLALKGDEKVLDIGTGSGYAAAVFSRLAAKVISIEKISELAERARQTLAEVGYNNVTVIAGDGRLGYPSEAPFAAINCAAASREIPPAWKEQLAEGGRMVLPLQKGLFQDFVKITKKGGQFFEESWGGVVFVPLS